MTSPVASLTPGSQAQPRTIRADESKRAPQLLEDRGARQRSDEQPLAFATRWNLIPSTRTRRLGGELDE